MNPIFFSVGPFSIRWYAIFMVLAFLLGLFIVNKEAKKRNIDVKLISDLIFYLIPISILGARIYYCAFEWNYYRHNVLDVIKIWEGGLAIHGGIIASLLFIIFYTKQNKLPLLKTLDIISPALIIGQAIGRWGNFFNGEAFGPITTIEKLKSLHIPNFIIKGMHINGHYYHPTFFYESLGCLVGFIILKSMNRFFKLKTGIVTSCYLIIYGTIRFFIEILRQDSLMLGSIKVAQLVSIIMIFSGLLLLLYSCWHKEIYDK